MGILDGFFVQLLRVELQVDVLFSPPVGEGLACLVPSGAHVVHGNALELTGLLEDCQSDVVTLDVWVVDELFCRHSSSVVCVEESADHSAGILVESVVVLLVVTSLDLLVEVGL